MQFNQGASIFTTDGKEVGRIDRVVIDPKTNEVTHIVIRKGFLFTKDKVVPVDLIAAGQVERIILRTDIDQLEHLPNFEETHYVLSDKEEPGHEAVSGPIGIAPPALYSNPPYSRASYIAETRTNIPEDTVAVKEGAKVIARDDMHVGNVEQVLTSHGAGTITHFLIARGLLQKEKKLIPVGWIDSIGEDELRLAIGSRTVAKLPNYEHA